MAFWKKKREVVILGKFHRTVFELQVPGKGAHPILKDSILALTTYQIIPPGNLPK